MILSSVLGVAVGGVVGGQGHSTRRSSAPAATIAVTTPSVLRNGEFFETRIDVDARRSVTRLVIGVSPSLWRSMTVNTTVPAASDETFEGGLFRYSFGALDPGEHFIFKIDGQVNPSLFASTAGQVVVFDGDVPLVRLPISTRVMP